VHFVLSSAFCFNQKESGLKSFAECCKYIILPFLFYAEFVNLLGVGLNALKKNKDIKRNRNKC
jgi:hypothetical protein